MRKTTTTGWPLIHGARRRKARAEAVAAETARMVAAAIGGGVDGQRTSCYLRLVSVCSFTTEASLHSLFLHNNGSSRAVEAHQPSNSRPSKAEHESWWRREHSKGETKFQKTTSEKASTPVGDSGSHCSSLSHCRNLLPHQMRTSHINKEQLSLNEVVVLKSQKL
ncbi:hypothetical protein ACFX2I_013278 [Malus domestica]